MLLLASGSKKAINYNKKLCECCETKCSTPLVTNLEYCGFDEIAKGVLRASTRENITSVDCIRNIDDNNSIVLLEIKNQKPSNIEINEITLKIKETMQYLHDYEPLLFQPYNTKFFLAIPEQKFEQILINNQKFSCGMQKFATNMVKQILKMFNDKYYKIPIYGTECILQSKIIQCRNTEILCG
jgi:hypothetical protein|nr:MAG TPA: hypothetical protein [Caudoviricetes sp.]